MSFTKINPLPYPERQSVSQSRKARRRGDLEQAELNEDVKDEELVCLCGPKIHLEKVSSLSGLMEFQDGGVVKNNFLELVELW
jgi:hypothetical protein